MPSNSILQTGLRQLSRIIDTVNDKIGLFIAFLAIPIVFCIMYEVISRRIFNAPTLWAYEMIVMCFGVYIILTPGYGLLKGSMVCVDILSKRFRPKTAHIVLLISYLLFFVPFVVCLLPATYTFANTSWLQREMSWSPWSPPVYPLKICIAIGWLLLSLQGISEMSKSIVALMEMRQCPDSSESSVQPKAEGK